MTRIYLQSLLLNLLLLLTAGSVAAQELTTYQASYSARSSGLSARAERSLERLEEGRYSLSQHMAVRVLGARLGEIVESSQFWFGETGLLADVYSYRQTGISSRKQSVRFEWQQGFASSSDDDETWQLPLSPGIVDKLNFQVQMRLLLKQPGVEELEVQLVNRDEIETHLYRITGSEIIETGLGRLDTLKVERVREPGSPRSTVFWLARDWHLLLVKFVQTEGTGSGTELLLEEATVAGQVVTPLP